MTVRLEDPTFIETYGNVRCEELASRVRQTETHSLIGPSLFLQAQALDNLPAEGVNLWCQRFSKIVPRCIEERQKEILIHARVIPSVSDKTNRGFCEEAELNILEWSRES